MACILLSIVGVIGAFAIRNLNKRVTWLESEVYGNDEEEHTDEEM